MCRAPSAARTITTSRKWLASAAPMPNEPYAGTIMVEDAGRRAAARIDMWCECGGHLWSLILQQHKGTIYAYARLELTHEGDDAGWCRLIEQWSTLPLAGARQ